ncbi:hypothetical protein Tco_0328032 [Tanacetum coccineum]
MVMASECPITVPSSGFCSGGWFLDFQSSANSSRRSYLNAGPRRIESVSNLINCVEYVLLYCSYTFLHLVRDETARGWCDSFRVRAAISLRTSSDIVPQTLRTNPSPRVPQGGLWD